MAAPARPFSARRGPQRERCWAPRPELAEWVGSWVGRRLRGPSVSTTVDLGLGSRLAEPFVLLVQSNEVPPSWGAPAFELENLASCTLSVSPWPCNARPVVAALRKFSCFDDVMLGVGPVLSQRLSDLLRWRFYPHFRPLHRG